MNTLPFMNVADIATLDTHRNEQLHNMYHRASTNNDFLINIDPDHNTSPNGLDKQCKNYDTSCEFRKMSKDKNNISLLHTNICSSVNKLKDFKYYLDNLDTQFSFIGISETWATILNKDCLNIPGYNHEQCIRTNKKKGGGTSLYILNSIQYKVRDDLALTKKLYESVFIEEDKALLNTNHNTIIGEIYKPPSSKVKNFNSELEKLLTKIKKEKKICRSHG